MLNSEWTSASASARSMKPSRLVSRFWNSAWARLRRSSAFGPPGTSVEKGCSATFRNSSIDSLPSLLASSSSNDFMRYFRKSARETSPFLAVSISTNQDGNGTAAGAADWPGGWPLGWAGGWRVGWPVVWACANAGRANRPRPSRNIVLIAIPQLPGAFVGTDRRLRHPPSVENRQTAIYHPD